MLVPPGFINALPVHEPLRVTNADAAAARESTTTSAAMPGVEGATEGFVAYYRLACINHPSVHSV